MAEGKAETLYPPGYIHQDQTPASESERVELIIKHRIEEELSVYERDLSDAEAKSKSAMIVEKVMADLRHFAGLNNEAPSKFIVSCTIMPKNGAGLHSAAACYWDNEGDHANAIRWENRLHICVVHVFTLRH